MYAGPGGKAAGCTLLGWCGVGSSAYILSGVPGVLEEKSPLKTALLLLLLLMLCTFEVVLDTSTHSSGLTAASRSNMVGIISSVVRLFTHERRTFVLVFPLLCLPRSVLFATTGEEKARSLLARGKPAVFARWARYRSPI